MHLMRSGMKSIMFSLLVIFLFSISGRLISQDVVQVLDRVYGLDQTLCNGKKYTYLPPQGTKRNQYLLSRNYIGGSVTLKGKIYQDLTLNYDIVNQQLLLKYEDEQGAMTIIEVSKAWLDSFSLGTMNFEFLNLEKDPRFFQVLGKGPLRILYFWRKELKLESTMGTYKYIFTPALRDSYVLMDGQLKPFGNKRSLIGLFDPGDKPAIKSYLRKNKIKVKRASDQVMADLITFIGKIR
jgi:hypothetical protein